MQQTITDTQLAAWLITRNRYLEHGVTPTYPLLHCDTIAERWEYTFEITDLELRQEEKRFRQLHIKAAFDAFRAIKNAGRAGIAPMPKFLELWPNMQAIHDEVMRRTGGLTQ